VIWTALACACFFALGAVLGWYIGRALLRRAVARSMLAYEGHALAAGARAIRELDGRSLRRLKRAFVKGAKK
jgi:hypothetical protein